MKLNTWSLCAAALALGSLAVAQTEKPKGDGAKEKDKGTPVVATHEVHIYKLGEVTDLDLKNGDASIGEIDDVIIDSRDGRIAYALVGKGGVMGIGETEHLVPWESIRVEMKDKDKLVGKTSLTAEQIEKAPVYRKSDPIDADLEKRARENAGVRPVSNSDRGQPTRFVSANELKGAAVRSADNADLGKIDEVVLAPKESCVAYTVLGTGGVLGLGEKHFALPWQKTEASYDKEQKLIISTPLVKEKLAKAPEYDGKDWKRMSSGPWVREVCTYWGAEPFWSHTAHAGSDREPGG